MRHTYEIYQLNNIPDGVDINEYRHVYSGEIEGDDTITMLEDLFVIFNLRHPDDFSGHSLSVSDIVILDGKKYYCEDFGWKALD